MQQYVGKVGSNGDWNCIRSKCGQILLKSDIIAFYIVDFILLISFELSYFSLVVSYSKMNHSQTYQMK